MLYTFIEIGGIIFWLLTGIVFLVATLSVDRDSWGNALWSIVIYIAAIVAFSNFNLLGWIAENAVAVVVGIVAYGIIGTLWTVAKWYFYVNRTARPYEAAKEDWLSTRRADNLVPVPKDAPINNTDLKRIAETMQRWDKYKNVYTPQTIVPNVRHERSRIIRWIAYWPFSAVGTIINDPLRRFGEMVYNGIGKHLQRISNHAFNRFPDFNNDGK